MTESSKPAQQHFGGTIPEAATVGNLLATAGVVSPHDALRYSEEVLFGLGGGIAFGYFLFEYEGHDPSVYIGTRYGWHDPAATVDAIVRAVGGTAIDNRTGSASAASRHLQEQLSAGSPVIVTADAAMLKYNGLPAAWEGGLAYSLSVRGQNGGKLLIDDRAPMPLAVSFKELADARNRIKKVKNAAITVIPPSEAVDLETVVGRALNETAGRDLSPGIPVRAFQNNFGLAGLRTWAAAINDPRSARGWRRVFSRDAALFNGMRGLYTHVALWSSDGAACRGMQATWLRSAANILSREGLNAAATAADAAADSWRQFCAALLPDEIEIFARARRALHRKHDVLRERGTDGINEIVQQAALLAEMGREAESGFRLSETERDEYFVKLGAAAQAVVAAEEAAMAALTSAC